MIPTNYWDIKSRVLSFYPEIMGILFLYDHVGKLQVLPSVILHRTPFDGSAGQKPV
jgi:hypothetical protein